MIRQFPPDQTLENAMYFFVQTLGYPSNQSALNTLKTVLPEAFGSYHTKSDGAYHFSADCPSTEHIEIWNLRAGPGTGSDAQACGTCFEVKQFPHLLGRLLTSQRQSPGN